jgi:2-polyprenyl-3-methyl-5-hydroxy-6-metoxy-1,4-benzoquinol methylase
MSKKIICDLCGENQVEFLFAQRDRMYNLPGKFYLYRCKNCGLIFLYPRPKLRQLAKFYPSNKYYSFKEIEEGLLEKKAYSSYSNKKLWNWILTPLYRSVEIVPRGNILDVGCGSGKFLKTMKNLGMVPYGVEIGNINEEFVKRNGLHIFKGNVREAKYKPNFFDVITLNHVFEHLANPRETLIELERILKQTGKLIIAVPNTKSWIFKIFDKNWVSIDSPRHLFLYGGKQLERYANDVGLTLITSRCYGNAPFFESLEIALKRNHNKKIFFNKFLHYFLLPISLIFNLFKLGDTIELTFIKEKK